MNALCSPQIRTSHTYTHAFFCFSSVFCLIEKFPFYRETKELKRFPLEYIYKKPELCVMVVDVFSMLFLLINELITNAYILTQFTAKTFRNHTLIEIRSGCECEYECVPCAVWINMDGSHHSLI